MAGPARYTIETVRQWDSTEELAAHWECLPQPAQVFPQAADWGLAAAQSLHAPETLHLIQLRQGREVVAIAPLTLATPAGPERLEFIGASTLFEPCGFNYRDEAALQALCRAVVDAGRPVVLQRIAADDPLAVAFEAAARGRGRLLQLEAAASPVVPICSSWEEYVRSASSRRRQDYRRLRRGLERLGKVEVAIDAPSESSVEAQLAEAMQVEAAGWKGRAGSAMLTHPRLRVFFGQLARRLARQGKLRLCFLRLDGTPIAMQIGAVHGGRWWVLKIGYDERWAEYSPGVQLMWDVLRAAFGNGSSSFEMLGSAEPWLTIWARQQRAYRTLVFYPYNGRGLVALGTDIMRAFARRLPWPVRVRAKRV